MVFENAEYLLTDSCLQGANQISHHKILEFKKLVQEINVESV